MEGVDAKLAGKARRKEKRLQSEPSSIEGSKNGGPRGVNVLDFAEARAVELSSMLKAIRSKSGTKRVFQRLPRHMRRRAMSHNLKRLPRRLRPVASKEIQGSDVFERPSSRRQRRKFKNLQKEYSRRQRSYLWLETHLWHAKRMHMANKWGYRLPQYLNAKGVRSTYRSFMYGCLLSDISYYQCIQVCGNMKLIISTLSSLFSTETGLSIGAKAFTSGQREGIAIMYHNQTYPFHPVGPVQFLWHVVPPKIGRREQDVDQDQLSVTSKLLIFCHPAMFEEAFTEVQEAISKKVSSIAETSGTNTVSCLSVQWLKDEFVRFRLLGPRSHAVLMEVLKPVLCFSDTNSLSNSAEGVVKENSSAASLPWWKDQCHVLQEHASELSSVYPTIKGAHTPSSFSRGTVIGMVVTDPRLSLPSGRTDMVSSFYPEKVNTVKEHICHMNEEGDGESEDEDEGLIKVDITTGNVGAASDGIKHGMCSSAPTFTVPILPPSVAYSSLWDDNVRRAVSLSRQPDHVLNEIRSKQFLTQDDLDNVRIPVVLLQQSLLTSCTSNSLNNSAGYGWDLLVPKNWGMAFWVALVYCGARACGLAEIQRCMLECCALQFPYDFPDTLSCRRESQLLQQELERKYRHFPPDKRPNYGKLSISAPFHYSWETLFADGTEAVVKKQTEFHSCHPGVSYDDSDIFRFYVLRSRTNLTALSQFMEHTIQRGCQRSQKGCQRSQRKFSETSCLHGDAVVGLRQINPSALVAISFEMFGRGKVSSWAALCVPVVEDLRSLVDNKAYSGPVEPINCRGATVVCNNFIHIGTSHLSKKQRRSLLKEAKNRTSAAFQSDVQTIEPLLLEELKLQPLTPSRLVMGYATRMGYLLSTSKFGGLGFVSLRKLIEVIELSYTVGIGHVVALVRSHGTQYRFVKLQLLT